MKIRTKLILTTVMLAVPLIAMWTITDIIINKNSQKHAYELIKFYGSTFSITIGRENSRTDKTQLPLFYRKDDLEDYIKDIGRIKKIDLVVLDTCKTIIADAIESNIGKKYNYKSTSAIDDALKYGTEGTLKEKSEDYPEGILLYVSPIKDYRNHVVGVLLMEYDNIILRFQKEAKNTQDTFLYGGFIVLLLTSFFSVIYFNIINKCLAKIVYTVRKFADGDYSVRIRSGRKDELGEIADALDSMVEQKQKSDERALLLNNAMKSANDMISVIDADANFMFVNDCFCRKYGYSRSEIIGKNVELITSEKNDYYYAKMFNAETFKNGWRGERWSKTKDGQNFLINLHLSPVKNSNGDFLGLVAVSNDITEKKLAQEALRISEEKFRQVFENIPVGIIYITPEGQLVNCNEIFLEIFNITRDEFNSFSFSRIEDAKFLEAYKLAQSGIIGRYEGDYQAVISKKVISLKAAFAPIINDDKIKGVVGIFEDISERKQIERFFFHDIINTAGNLRCYLELLNDEDFKNEEKEDPFKYMQSITNQLIAEIVSHRSILTSDKTNMKLNITVVDSLELLNSIRMNFKQLSGTQGINISISADCGNIKMLTDKALLGRVIENLIKNAIEASEKGHTVTLGLEEGNDFVTFRVHNQTFIPPEIQNKIFQRSFSTKGGGRGIGTYSIKYLTEIYLKGDVYFSSEENIGTSFYVKLPLDLNAVNEKESSGEA